uniref:Uncharacterized protein n=1 Tax=Avena sativa TaxID=4498 RepID=A0ACD5V7Q2_AVESA
MAAEIVCAATGVINPLLGKLTQLVGEEYKKLSGVRKQASFLKAELSAMQALLDRLELMDKLDSSTKDWRDYVREMSYDMENCIDDYIHDLEGAAGKPGFVRKMAQRLRRLGRRHQIANRIEELKVLAADANSRRERYKFNDCIHSSSEDVVVDPRLSAMYTEAAGLVGIDEPREELVRKLSESEKMIKVVSIVGFGGLGKTTLAKQVYDQIGGQFQCKAFVSVSQRPDMASLLSHLQLKLGVEEYSRAHQVGQGDIIDSIREYLKHKRYLIVVDDLWDQPAWNIIRCVFPEGDNGGTVIVTTRVEDVAYRACHDLHGHVYRMKPLGIKESERLFFNRVFRSEDSGCASQYAEVSAQILKKCGGLPLAIITIASLLETHQARSRSDWERIANSLGSNFAADPTLEGMRNILNLSYIHLPPRLRVCFLYLGLYPEDREVERDDLARQWVAEGFISSVSGLDLEDVAKSYFNELINRSMIQPGRVRDGEVFSCRVHDMMLDLILRKCAEVNFLNAAYSYAEMEGMHTCKYKVRRLSLNLRAGGASATPGSTLATSLSQVRSFAQFGKSIYPPPVEYFKHIRVLVFKVAGSWTTNLTAIGHLFQLRYLKFSAYSVELPAEIRGLVHLNTLEMECESVARISPDIVHLPNLFHLTLPSNMGLPEGMRNMTSLRTLDCSNMLESSPEDIKGLGELTNLRELSICLSRLFIYSPLVVEGVDALVSSIGKLRELRHLDLHYGGQRYGGQLESLADPPPLIEEINLPRWKFLRVPKWIGELSCLRFLSLRIAHASTDEVRLLGELPCLIYASFCVLCVPNDMVVIGDGSFPVLEKLSFVSPWNIMEFLVFQAGAMPKLRLLALEVQLQQWGGVTPAGMHHLLGLQHVSVRIKRTDDEIGGQGERVLPDVECLFRNALQAHPRQPTLVVFK